MKVLVDLEHHHELSLADILAFGLELFVYQKTDSRQTVIFDLLGAHWHEKDALRLV